MKIKRVVIQVAMWALLVATVGVFINQTHQMTLALSDYFSQNWRLLFWSMPVIAGQIAWLEREVRKAELGADIYKMAEPILRFVVLALGITTFVNSEAIGMWLNFDLRLWVGKELPNDPKLGKDFLEAGLAWFAILIAFFSVSFTWRKIIDRF